MTSALSPAAGVPPPPLPSTGITAATSRHPANDFFDAHPVCPVYPATARHTISANIPPHSGHPSYPPRPLAPLQQVAPYSATVPRDVTDSAVIDVDATASQAPAVLEPQRPDYSPITPKVQPVLPARVPAAQPPFTQHVRANEPQTVSPSSATMTEPHTVSPKSTTTTQPPPPGQGHTDLTSSHVNQQPPSVNVDAPAPPAAQFMPRPKPQPFSSEDSTDAIALRAAISALQFQKKKAQADVRTLEAVREKALQDPLLFKSELAAGRILEQKPKMGDVYNVLDISDGEDEDDDDEDEDEDQVKSGTKRASVDGYGRPPSSKTRTRPQRQPSPPPSPFHNIPGPQNVVRMPPINWDKYHVMGAPLDELHEQQRRWPGSAPYSKDRGREHSIAAPFSPFHDAFTHPDGSSAARSAAGAVSATGTISEHPMETRRGHASRASGDRESL